MEKRRESLKAAKLCRFCLSQDQSLDSLYERNNALKNAISLHLKILSCVSIEVFPSDKMPGYICNRCKTFMNLFYDFKQIVRRTDESIFQYLQNGTPMETIDWPASLSKILPSNEINVVKTLEGGTTIQLSSQEISDSDEDDGNVYNIKIGDGLDDTNTTCIKVVTSSEQDKEDSTQSGKALQRWACGDCDCAYPLQQLLALHRRRKHRPRSVACDLCGKKFFSKYDLSSHLLRHTDETPFQCVACDKKFKRLILLKRHEKLVHSDLPQLECPSCPATFLSIEELETHQKKHVPNERPHSCSICDKKFYEKTTLRRHIHVVHNREPTFRCGYCPERFVSLSKLTKHVRSHAGDRPYPCKYCDKSFTKSHHYTRHVRVKHRAAGGGVGGAEGGEGAVGGGGAAACPRCGVACGDHDELVYHCALHATQDLTCPLCHETFLTVDAVTAHIKTHVNGVEFMCDFCELVFTTKEKLDDHLVAAHEDEVRQEESEESSGAEESSAEDSDHHDHTDHAGINLKEEGDHMVIEINKGDYIINKTNEPEVKSVVNSEDSESENTYTELATVDTLAALKKNEAVKSEEKPEIKSGELKPVKKTEQQLAPVLRRNDDIKRKSEHPVQAAVVEKKEKKSETNSGGANDKSLRLLEKELQDLKRTNSKPEIQKASPKNLEMLRNKRLPIQTSTPKRAAEEKKLALANKTLSQERKPERRQITKENKEPREVKETKNNNGNTKEEKETPKAASKNGSSVEKTSSCEGVRRSTRPSKVKDYARLVRDADAPAADAHASTDDDDDYTDADVTLESRPKVRRVIPIKVKPADTPPRKRGRPRKDSKNSKETPAKIKKDDIDPTEEDKSEDTPVQDKSNIKENKINAEAEENETNQTTPKTPPEQKPFSSDLLVSPSGQTLKKVPIKALPPGIKPLPLPVNARPIASGELCEMQIGKKVVKVQKIVMTKAEVEAMAKKGLVEMKDGTMVLKQGIKLPTMESVSSKPSNLGEGDTGKESLSKKEKAVPTRCDLGDDS